MKTVINYGMRIAAFFFVCGFGELLCRGLLTFTNNLSFQTILWQSFISAVLFSVLWLGIVFLIGRRVKMVLLPLVAFTILNTIVEVFVLARYRRRLGGGWITLVMTSSLDEVCSFIVSNLEILFWGVIAILGSALIVRFYHKMALLNPSARTRLIGGFVVMVSLGGISICSLVYKVSPPAYVGFLPSTLMSAGALIENERFLMASRAPLTIRPIEGVGALPICFFVIGESACRSHWSLYGYNRDTTPSMLRLKDSIYAFTDVQTVYPYTEQSMRAICVAKTDSRGGICTLAGLCKAAGYKCALVSGQGRWKSIDVGDSLFFKGVDESVFLADKQLDSLVYDDAVIPYAEDFLRTHADKPIIVFIHLYGSHFPFELRVPQDKRFFSSGDFLVDSYDDSIRFTDSILGRLQSLLAKDERPSVLIYLSDHGESPDSGRTRYIADRNCWQIPMTVWLSPSYRNRYPTVAERLAKSTKRPLQNDSLIPGWLEILRITGLQCDETENFLNDQFKCPIREVEFN